MNSGSTDRGNQATHYIPGLDGLRALAVLAVLGYHLIPTLLPGGYIGVDIFFVISGFLITSLLVNEYASKGKINLKQFWYRRARRLLPALVVVTGVTSAIALFVRGDMLVGIGRQILGALTFSNNWVEVAAGSNYFDDSNTHLFTNFWSLAVEEQFYLVWPLVVALLVGVTWFRERSKVSILLAGMVAISSMLLMAGMFHGENATRVYYGSDTHLFGLMIGAGLAFWVRSKTSIHALRRLQQPFWWLADTKHIQKFGFASLVGLVILLLTMSDTSPLAYYGGLALASMLAAVVIIATISRRSALQRLFTFKPLEWVGIRSYGIYLWHWPLLVLLSHALPAATSQWIVPVSVLVLTLICATASYRYIETPIRRQGFWAIVSRGIRRRAVIIDDAVARRKIRPHPVLVGSLVIVALAIGSIVSAPAKTQAQLRIEAGQQAIKKARTQPPKPNTPEPSPQAVAGAQTPPPAASAAAITGYDITVIGDSVTLASATALQERFPGIYIDAEISRSMRRGGIETVDNLNTAGNLRKVVVIALATNGYFGTGNLDNMVTELAGRKIVFVTAHVDREWTAPNNDDLHKLVQKYPNVSVAEWDMVITGHPDDLSEDGIHPNAQGATFYADCVAKALGL